MTVGHQVPVIVQVNQAIRVGFTGKLLALATTGITSMVAEAHSGAINNSPAQLPQHLRFGEISRGTGGDKADTALKVAHLVTQLFWQNPLYLASSRLCRRPVLGIEILRHKVAAQQQHRRFLCAKTEWG